MLVTEEHLDESIRQQSKDEYHHCRTCILGVAFNGHVARRPYHTSEGERFALISDLNMESWTTAQTCSFFDANGHALAAAFDADSSRDKVRAMLPCEVEFEEKE
jgi:hypothetical protein